MAGVREDWAGTAGQANRRSASLLAGGKISHEGMREIGDTLARALFFPVAHVRRVLPVSRLESNGAEFDL